MSPSDPDPDEAPTATVLISEDETSTCVIADNPLLGSEPSVADEDSLDPSTTLVMDDRDDSLDPASTHVMVEREHMLLMPPVSAREEMSLEQYASFCAEVAVFPRFTAVILKRYRLPIESRVQLDTRWRDRFKEQPDLHQRFGVLYDGYRDWLKEHHGDHKSLLIQVRDSV